MRLCWYKKFIIVGEFLKDLIFSVFGEWIEGIGCFLLSNKFKGIVGIMSKCFKICYLL